MRLYIMTRGRVGKQTTLANIPSKWAHRTILVCPPEEGGQHNWNYIPFMHPEPNYSRKFQWILDGLPDETGKPWDDGEKAVILDDDLVFSKKNEQGSLRTIRDPEELEPLFDQMNEMLNEYALVGVHPRQMGQNTEPPFVLNGRIICIQGFNRRLIGNVKVDHFPILADVSLNLQLLSRGMPNAIITTFFQDHGPCQAPGGCSIYRTPDMQREAVTYLAEQYPGFVKVVERRPKVAKWMGDVRYDYTAQWKKLYEYGKAKREAA